MSFSHVICSERSDGTFYNSDVKKIDEKIQEGYKLFSHKISKDKHHFILVKYDK